MVKNSKFYAVKSGRKTGVFTTWEECKEQVQGYSNAVYKSFWSKEEAEEFVGINSDKKENDKMNMSSPYAFVDGSFNKYSKVYGFGGFLVANNKYYPIYGRGSNSEWSSMRNVAGEILGAVSAVNKAIKLGLDEITILYDYKGIEAWVTGGWRTNNPCTKRYKEEMQKAKEVINIKFYKVKGHSGVIGNEVADLIAKYSVGNYLTESQREKVLYIVRGSNND